MSASATSLMISMPTQGQITTPAVRSLLGLTQHLQRSGIRFCFETYQFSDIVFSRNQLASVFLSDDRFSHMLMLDADLEYPVSAVQRLIAFEAPFTAATYAQKSIPWTKLRHLIEEDAGRPEQDRRATETLLSEAWTYTLQRSDFGGTPWRPRCQDGFITVPAVGTGFMLIAREVLERMIETGSAPRLARHEGLKDKRSTRYHDFFSHRPNADGTFLYAEDQSFCQRWVDHCGGEIWLDTTSLITHWGQTAFPACYEHKADLDFQTAVTRA